MMDFLCFVTLYHGLEVKLCGYLRTSTYLIAAATLGITSEPQFAYL